MNFGKSKYSLPSGSKTFVYCDKFLFPLAVDRLRNTSNIDILASLPYFLRRSLDKHTILRISSLIVVDWICKLESWIKRKSHLLIFISSCHSKLIPDVIDISNWLEKFDQPRLRSITSCRHLHVDHCLQFLLPLYLQISNLLLFLLLGQIYIVLDVCLLVSW